MKTEDTKIVVIHDGLIPIQDPLLVELKNKFGNEQVVHLENSNQGLDYVLNNLSQKMVVLLDINFSKGELSGIQVFDDIRNKTALVYVILITADEYYKIKNEDLIFLINHDAFAIESVTTDYTNIISLVEKAVHKLEVRIDSVLEEWIMQQPAGKRNLPYIRIKNGESYTLNQILESIRQQTEIGQKLERNILKLAIDLLVRQRRELEND